MKKQTKYNLYTDASFDNRSNIATISIYMINKTFSKLKELQILEKVKNGRYMLLV